MGIQIEPTVPTPPADCPCDSCTALAREYWTDPEMLAYLRRNLLRRGWAGTMTDTERAYVRAHSTWSRGTEAGAERLRNLASTRKSTNRAGEVAGDDSEYVAAS